MDAASTGTLLPLPRPAATSSARNDSGSGFCLELAMIRSGSGTVVAAE
jgi:hypothetical protein